MAHQFHERGHTVGESQGPGHEQSRRTWLRRGVHRVRGGLCSHASGSAKICAGSRATTGARNASRRRNAGGSTDQRRSQRAADRDPRDAERVGHRRKAGGDRETPDCCRQPGGASGGFVDGGGARSTAGGKRRSGHSHCSCIEFSAGTSGSAGTRAGFDPNRIRAGGAGFVARHRQGKSCASRTASTSAGARRGTATSRRRSRSRTAASSSAIDRAVPARSIRAPGSRRCRRRSSTRQSPEVDYVSGATQSTNAFYYAVVEALQESEVSDARTSAPSRR